MKLFKLKRKNIILVSLLAIAGFLGISSVAVNTVTGKEAPVAEKAEAASHNASTRIWFDTGGSSTGGWAKDSASLHAWMIGYDKYHKLKWDSTVNKYYITTENAATGFVLCRANGGVNVDGQTSWQTSAVGWNQSSDINFGTTSQNMININVNPGTNPSSWSEFKIQNSGSTIYINTGGENSGWATDSAKISAWCWKTNGSEWANASWDSSIGFYKFNLPGNCTGFTLYRGSAYRTGTTWGNTGTQYNTSDIIFDSKKTLLNGADDVPGTLSWGYYCDTYFYYVNDDNEATGNYVYSWGNSEYFGSWPGTQITSIVGISTVEGDVKFNGSSAKKIYKIPYSTFAGDTGIKFRGGDDGYQTANYTLSTGAAYIWSDSSSGSYVDRGAAIDLILREETLRKAAINESICNIEKGSCSTLYSDYNSSNANVKSFINTSYTLTYPSSSTSASKVDVSLERVFYQIGLNGGNITKSMFTGLSVFGSENNFSTLIIIVSSSVALLSVTALSILVIRKRKSKED